MSSRENQVSVVLLAAGSGNRMQAGENKLFLPINKIPMLYRTLVRLDHIEMIDSIILVCKDSEQGKIESMVRRYGTVRKMKDLITGGAERSDSVNCGLEKVNSMQTNGIVMTHDGARPFITEGLVRRLVEAVDEESISIPSLPVFETVRKRETTGKTSVVDRQTLYTVQTPQVFHVKHIRPCFLESGKKALNLTDEASYFEVAGKRVKLVEGEKWNIKLTTPEDILWAECLLKQHKSLQLGRFEKV